MKDDVNPMDRAHAAPRCTATAKRTGARCKGPAVAGWAVCRMHGAGAGIRKDRPTRPGNTACDPVSGSRNAAGSTKWYERRVKGNTL